MADENEGNVPTEDGKSTSTEGQTEDVSGLKSALAKEREARRKAEQEAKTNADAAKRLKQAEDADKSEMDKLNERASAAEKRAEKAEANELRLTVASEKGLTSAQMKRISGSTREELEADADEYRKEHGLAKSEGDEGDDGGKGDSSSRRRPKEQLRPGASSDDEDSAQDPDKLAESILKSPF